MQPYMVPDGGAVHSPPTGFGTPFGSPDIPVPVVLFFLLVAGMILFAIVSAVVQYVENSNSPVLETPARVVAKRSQVSRNGGRRGSYISTTYFVTFEADTGERRELEVKGNQFGLLVEGDRGVLVSQGTWFKDFVRSAS